MRDRPSARGATAAWQFITVSASVGIGLLVAAIIGPLLVARGSAGAYVLVTVTVVTAVVLVNWGRNRVTGLRAQHRGLPAPNRSRR